MKTKEIGELREFFKQEKYEKYLSIPPIPSGGMRVFVGSKKIPNLNADNKYAPAFKNGEFRKDLRKKYSSLALDGKSPENDPIEKTIYYYFPFTKIKNL